VGVLDLYDVRQIEYLISLYIYISIFMYAHKHTHTYTHTHTHICTGPLKAGPARFAAISVRAHTHTHINTPRNAPKHA